MIRDDCLLFYTSVLTHLFLNESCVLCLYPCRHQTLEHQHVNEASAIQQELEATQEILDLRDRELQEAKEKVVCVCL